MPEGGIVKVKLAIDEHHVRMSVDDNGIGMTHELIPKAFDLFTQAKRTSDRSQGGNEHGLMMVEMLLSSMGHEVVSTSRPGEGMAPARALRPDVCILDIGLPDIDGLPLVGMCRPIRLRGMPS